MPAPLGAPPRAIRPTAARATRAKHRRRNGADRRARARPAVDSAALIECPASAPHDAVNGATAQCVVALGEARVNGARQARARALLLAPCSMGASYEPDPTRWLIRRCSGRCSGRLACCPGHTALKARSGGEPAHWPERGTPEGRATAPVTAIYNALVRNDAVCLYVTSAHRPQSPEAKSSSPSSSTVAKKSGIAKRTPDVTRPTRCAFSHPELKTRARPCTCETHRERETRDGAVSAGEWSGMNAPAPAV